MRALPLIILIAAVLYFFIHMMGWMGVIASFFATIPVWMYFIIAGIFFSGYKVIEGVLEDKRADYEHIKREGEVFIQRMEEERKRRKGLQ